ncbi:MAG: GatB/YqeY domain-containing protein [Thermodesulfovibrionales bacterium]
MGLAEKINDDMKASMKARDELRLSTIRMLKAAMKNREIEKGAALSDDDVVAVASSLIKQRRDSVEQYRKGGRADLADREEAEIKVLEGYLPAQLSAEEIASIIKEAVAQAGASSPADMGKVMKLVMPRVKGKADGKLVNEKVKELLGG